MGAHILTEWTPHGLLRIELDAGTAQLLYDRMMEVRGSPEMGILSMALGERLAKPQRRRIDAKETKA